MLVKSKKLTVWSWNIRGCLKWLTEH